jgi:hypothetical protein
MMPRKEKPSRNSIQRAANCQGTSIGDVGVDHGGADAAVFPADSFACLVEEFPERLCRFRLIGA